MKFAKAILLLAQVNIKIYGFLWGWIFYGISYGARYGLKCPNLSVINKLLILSVINKLLLSVISIFYDNEHPVFKFNQKGRIPRTGSYGRAGIFVL